MAPPPSPITGGIPKEVQTEIAAARKAVERADERLEAARMRRAAAVMRALNAGAGLREVARVAGLSPRGVSLIRDAATEAQRPVETSKST